MNIPTLLIVAGIIVIFWGLEDSVAEKGASDARLAAPLILGGVVLGLIGFYLAVR